MPGGDGPALAAGRPDASGTSSARHSRPGGTAVRSAMRILALSLLSLCFALEGRVGAAPCVVPAECDDSNPCTEDACAGLAGCVHANITAICDDGDACIGGDRCRDGSCL